ncbi:MAG: response regulator [Spirulinaceae cyanobacterium]
MLPSLSHSLALDPLRNLLLRYQQQQWTGKVLLEGVGRHRIRNTLFLNLGRLVWATGGIHPVRRWQRHLLHHCGQLEPAILALRRGSPANLSCWDYEILLVLLRRGILPGDRLERLIAGVVTEVLWDLLQWTSLAQLQPQPCRWSLRDYEGVRPASAGLRSHAPALNVTRQLAIAQQQWQQWQSAGLSRTSPHLAPKIINRAQFAAQLPAAFEPTWQKSLNGQRSLRDLAGLLKQDLVPLTRSLLPALEQGTVVLEAIADLPRPRFAPATPTAPEQPLVAYIDPSPQSRQQLETVLTQAGYRTLAIAASEQVLPQLTHHCPRLILLDLMMPIVNGYELCRQLRQVSALQAVPIIILTGQNGMVDRVRAKRAGATDFVSKPIAADKLLPILQPYL